MLIRRDSVPKNYFENVVIEVTDTADIKAFVLQYYPSSAIKPIKTHNSFTFDFSFNFFPIEYENDGKISVNGCVVTFILCKNGGDIHPAGPRCMRAGNEDNLIYDSNFDLCPSGGGSSPTDFGDPNATTGSHSGYNSSDPTPGGSYAGNSTYTQPIPCYGRNCPEELEWEENEFFIFLNNLTTAQQQQWDNLTTAQQQEIKNFLQQENYSDEAEAFVLEYLEITIEIPNARFDRFVELTDLIEQDPWALLQDCAEQNGMDISNYQDLYNHELPQACEDRLNGMIGYSNQPISDGNVPCTNMDYYSVEITQMPDLDGDGNPDTEAEVYQAFREKFTDLASGEKDDFNSSCDVPFDFDDVIDIWWQFNPMSGNDGNLFLSNNPVSSILLIDAGANNPFVNANADLGAIIVSDFTPNNWTISTIQTPDTGTQPFSGNRQWGWLINESGNLEIYTRAVDVARVADIFLEQPATWLGSNIECQQDTYYDIAEATWENMQQEIADWINDDEISNGGQASINPPKVVRIERETIEEILTTDESDGSIDQILNNCSN
ncbi:MAG TPA: hypothetical protein VFM70_05855 [Salinimicrobium sp.]|nr:hypothetical protein [Salinimicrobium sp.]